MQSPLIFFPSTNKGLEGQRQQVKLSQYKKTTPKLLKDNISSSPSDMSLSKKYLNERSTTKKIQALDEILESRRDQNAQVGEPNKVKSMSDDENFEEVR